MPRRSPRRPPRSLFLGLSLALALSQPLPVLAQTPDPSASASAPADPTTVARTRFSEALALARKNLEVRKTVRAYQLAVLAALGADDRTSACELGTEALKLPHMTSMLRDTIHGACEKR